MYFTFQYSIYSCVIHSLECMHAWIFIQRMHRDDDGRDDDRATRTCACVYACTRRFCAHRDVTERRACVERERDVSFIHSFIPIQTTGGLST